MTQPCPFCGSTSVATAPVFTRRRNSPRYAYCRVCGARGPSVADQPDAIEAWSRRPGRAEAPAVRTIDEVRLLLRERIAEYGPAHGDDLRESVGVPAEVFWDAVGGCRHFRVTGAGWDLTPAGRRALEADRERAGVAKLRRVRRRESARAGAEKVVNTKLSPATGG